MEYTIEESDKYQLITLNIEKLDSSVSPSLKSLFIKICREGCSNIILDMQHVKYADSSGLSAILVGDRSCKENDGIFILSAVNDHVLKLINISQLNSILNLLPTSVEAVDAVFMNELEKDFRAENNKE